MSGVVKVPTTWREDLAWDLGARAHMPEGNEEFEQLLDVVDEHVRELVVHIIGKAESSPGARGGGHIKSLSRNRLRHEQRQRAKERGIDLEAGDAA